MVEYEELAQSRLNHINDLNKESDRLKQERDRLYQTSIAYIDSLHEEIQFLKMRGVDE